MQRIVIPAVFTLFALPLTSAAIAGPLNLNPEPPPGAAYAQLFAAPPPAPARNYQSPASSGGGVLQMLFGQRPREWAPPQNGAYQGAAPAAPPPSYYQSEPAVPPGYGQSLLEQPGQYGSRAIDPRYLKQEVRYDGQEKAGTIIINTQERLLYLVHGDGHATRYGIGVGRPGFAWAGVHHVTNKREWPDWTPPDDMLKRRPDLPRHMEGGLENPLGARAMYLGSTLYRIHGSNEPWTIGQAVSSGCIRMRNEDVVDLYNRVKVGTKVVVI